MSKYKKVVALLAAVVVGVTLSSGTAVAATKKPAAKPAATKKPAAKPAAKAKSTAPAAESTAAKPKNQARSVVSADWLAQNLSDPKVKIIEVSTEAGLYERGHIQIIT